MYIVKNSWTSITRTKGRNILIGIIMSVITIACAVALAIKSSATNLVNSYEIKNDITATLSIDRRSMMQNSKPEEGEEYSRENMEDIFSSITALTIDDINNYGDSDYITDYYYTDSISIDASDLEVVSSTTDQESTDNGFNRRPQMQRQEEGDFTLTGYSNLSAMSDFVSGRYTMESGSIFTDFESYSCIISDELAEYNSLEAGDTITLVSPYDEDLTYTLTVSGIYTDNDDSEDNAFNMFSDSANKIITNTTVVSKIISDDTENYRNNLNPTFIVKDKDSIEKFESELEDKGLNEYYTLNTNVDEVEAEIKPIQNVSNFSTTFLIIVLVIGGLVLFVLNLINIRERKYEIGVLRTIGMKKSLVIGQFCAELFIVALFSIIIGSTIGYFIAPSVSNSLITSEIESIQSENENIGNNFGMPGGMGDNIPGGNKGQNTIYKNTKFIDTLDVKVDLNVIIKLSLIGILLTLVSSGAALINISRFSPLKILKERS